MAILVNGERVPDELIDEELRRIRGQSEFTSITNSAVRAFRVKDAAETYATDRVLLRQEAEKDTRPVDVADIERELERLRAIGGCRPGVSEDLLRRSIEQQIRFHRAARAITGPVRGPSLHAVREAYERTRHLLQLPEEVHAAHIVRNVDEHHSEAEARAGIEAALAELESGEAFSQVADRHSDCKGNGGDLGSFARGVMVEEFDSVVFALEAGERSGIFRTPFGFHVAEVRARKPARIADFEEAAPQIERGLLAAAEEKALGQAFAELRRRARIERCADPPLARAAASGI